VTGMCVKMLNFSNEEFVETACVSGTGGLDDIFEKPGDHVNSSAADSSKRKKARVDQYEPHAAHSSSHLAQQQRDAATTRHGNKMDRCSVNKKNRYRSWVYHRVMHNQIDIRGVPRSGARTAYCKLPAQLHSQQAAAAIRAPHKSDRDTVCSSWAVLSRDTIRQGDLQVSVGLHSSQERASQHCAKGGHMGVPVTPPSADSSVRIRNLIYTYVWDIVCSSKWESSMQTEVCFYIKESTRILHLSISISLTLFVRRSRRCASKGGLFYSRHLKS
jgi:hypothetical protein